MNLTPHPEASALLESERSANVRLIGSDQVTWEPDVYGPISGRVTERPGCFGGQDVED